LQQVVITVVCQHVDFFDLFFFFSSRRRHTRFSRDWSSDVCSSDLTDLAAEAIDLPDPRLPRYGRDYDIGDLVTVELDEGVELADMVTGARLQAPGDGTYDLSVIIGARDAVSDDVTVAIRSLRQRIAKLEGSQ